MKPRKTTEKKKQYFIWFDGEEWEFLYRTLNKRAFKNKDDDRRLFAKWQVVQGYKEFKQMNKAERFKEN